MSALANKKSLYGPLSPVGSPGLDSTAPGSGKGNSPDTVASNGKGGLFALSQIASTSLLDRDGKIKKYHP